MKVKLLISFLLMTITSVEVVANVCDSISEDRRTLTGRCNNLIHPDWGVAWNIDQDLGGEPVVDGIFTRLSEPVEYANVQNRTSPRDETVNPVIATVDILGINEDQQRQWSHTNLLFVYMVQFVAHDMALTVAPSIDPVGLTAGVGKVKNSSGDDFLVGLRSDDYIDNSGVPQQINGASAFLDLSPTYGPTERISNALRTFEGGLLKTAARKTFEYKHRNTPSRDLCNCIDTTTGEPFGAFNEGLTNAKEVLVLSAPGFTPEPFPHLGKCVSPAASFGTTFIPGIGVVPATPGVYTCPNPALGTPPMLLPNISCSIDYAALNDPSRTSFSWTIPDGVDWMPFISETEPAVPFDELLASTTDPAQAFAAGDFRATENLGIITIQNLWLREHNKNARRIAAEEHDLTDEEIFQKARAWTIGVYQNTIYNELLPMILGKKAYKRMGFKKHYKDDDYNPTTDPRTGNSFAAAMRFGHSMVTRDVFPIDPVTFERIPTIQKQLPPNFFGLDSPSVNSVSWVHLSASAQSTSMAPVDEMMAFIGGQVPSGAAPDDAIMAGIINSRAQAVDRLVEPSMNNADISNCFTGNVAISVPAFSVFRGRTHGIPSYHALLENWTGKSIYGRKKCPRPNVDQEYDPIECFRYLTNNKDENFAAALRHTFKRLDLIDPFVGLIIESESRCPDCQYGQYNGDIKGHKKGKKLTDLGVVGPTSAYIIGDQFYRSKIGDRFWFENSIHGWTTDELHSIRNTTMKDLISTHFPSLAVKLNGYGNVLLGKTTYN
ncbi:peroxidase family protein [uncultured Shewanella sp.]|uniref:peroxidase family protein n=1 Tax=uncultured Shewanella sp. TaxID=173975 RepID=UPI00260DE587|nr:peroxidase family protein [uncultured Shewanella sp.]